MASVALGNRPSQLVLARIVWAALLLSVVVYFGLAGALAGEGIRNELTGPSEHFRGVVFSLTIIQTMMVYAVYRRIVSIAHDWTDPTPQPRPTEEPARSLLPLYVVCWGVSESIAIVGLIVALVGGRAGTMPALFVWSLALLIAVHPRAAHLARG